MVGLGPGDPQFLTAQAQSALEEAEVLCGYPVYLDLVRPYYPEKEYYATGMTKELDRCRWALETAHSGRTVALVCSGDAGVYGMASPLLELAEGCPDVTVEVVPGLTAALSGGAVLAPCWPMISVLLFRPASPRGSHRKRAGRSGHGRLLHAAVQPLPRGRPDHSAWASASCCKTARPRTPSVGWCATSAGTARVLRR